MQTADEWFNQELRACQGRTLGAGVLIDLGMASPFEFSGWLAAKMMMNQSILRKALERHNLTIPDLLDLPSLLRAPAMICKSRTADNAFVVITERLLRGEPVVAAIHKHETRNSGCFNDIRSVHLRPLADIRRWIEQGLVLYEEKEKTRVWLQDSAPCN